MKSLIGIIGIVCFMAIAMVSVSSCGNKAATDQAGKEYTSKYICPMHCEGSGSEEAGTCPVCGMDYVLNEEHQGDGHDHHDHSGHDH